MKKLFLTATITSLLTLSFSAFAAQKYDLKKGKEIYDKSCFTCHATGVADAPKLHEVKHWDAHFAEAEAEAKKNPTKYKSAMDYLVEQVVKGRGAMPPKGMCNDCTYDDYADAISYMRQKP